MFSCFHYVSSFYWSHSRHVFVRADMLIIAYTINKKQIFPRETLPKGAY